MSNTESTIHKCIHQRRKSNRERKKKFNSLFERDEIEAANVIYPPEK